MARWMFWVPLQRPVGLNSLGGARINQPADREFASLHANLRYLYANRPFRLVVRLCSNFIFHLMARNHRLRAGLLQRSWPCPPSCSASKAAYRDRSRRRSLSCASATGEDAFGPEVMSQPPLEMSLTILSRSIWNYLPLNDATGVSR